MTVNGADKGGKKRSAQSADFVLCLTSALTLVESGRAGERQGDFKRSLEKALRIASE